MPTTRKPLQPASREELQAIVEQEIAAHGNACDLNHIDVSRVTNMEALFKDSPFNGDISRWDVSNVRSFQRMFEGSAFLGDVSSWTMVCPIDALDAPPWEGMLDPKQLAVHHHASLFHWVTADMGTHPVTKQVQEFHDNNRDLTHALASTLVERATLMHAMWRQDNAMALSAKTAQSVQPVDGTGVGSP